MSPIGFPQTQLASLHDVAARVLEVRPVGIAPEVVARDLLAGFFDVCMRMGLDKVLVEIAAAFAPIELDDRFALADHPQLLAAVAERVALVDDGGPRAAKLRQYTEALIISLTLEPTETPDRTIALTDIVRLELTAALAAVIDVQLGLPQIRGHFIAKAREACEERYRGAFEKLTEQLDDSGTRMLRQPKVPLDAVQAVQQYLTDARIAVIERAANIAIDKAAPVLARANADAAARIDQPISHRLTPRQVAIKRACDAKVPKVASAIVLALAEGLRELCGITWQAEQKIAKPYAASQTFAVGDVIEHPKFGRGTVTTIAVQRIDVEFTDGPHTLVHARR